MTPPGMGTATTLADVLESLARVSDRGILFVGEDDHDRRFDYTAFARLVRGVAAWLGPVAGPGRAVAVLTSDCLVQTAVFWACGISRRVSSVLPPPTLMVTPAYYRQTVPRMLEALDPAALVTDRQTAARLEQALPPEALRERTVLLWEDAPVSEPAAESPPPAPAGPDRCYVQFSSGASGHPKGVVLTHQAITSNVHAMCRRLETVPHDVGLSWLPLYHDMGLIGGHLVPAFTGMEHVLMRPMTFLARPSTWLERASRHRATMAVAPSFAYDMAAARVKPEQLPAGFSLAPMRAMLNGSEPVRPGGLTDFVAAFAGAGLSASAFVPCYGLAESTLAVTICPPGHPSILERVERRALEQDGVATPAPADSKDVSTYVSVGPALDGCQVRILDDGQSPLPDGRVGEIAVHGPSLMAGYLEADAESPFVTDPAGLRWLRTGDLGFVRNGQLFVTGRSKDVLVIRGRNHDPADLEAAAERVSGVRPGHTVAFSYLDGTSGREFVVLLAETTPEAGDDVSARIASRVSEVTGVVVDRVKLVGRGQVQRTTSGKKIRHPMKLRYLRERQAKDDPR